MVLRICGLFTSLLLLLQEETCPLGQLCLDVNNDLIEFVNHIGMHKCS